MKTRVNKRSPRRVHFAVEGTETRLTLAPGQNGSKKLLATYGERLVCVRYRYDAARRLPLWEVDWKTVLALALQGRVVPEEPK